MLPNYNIYLYERGKERERENYIYSLIHVSIRVFIISFPI